MKVLPTQPDHPAIPEEEGDDEDAHERIVGEEDAGVEVCLDYWLFSALRLKMNWMEEMKLILVLYALKPDSSWYSST